MIKYTDRHDYSLRELRKIGYQIVSNLYFLEEKIFLNDGVFTVIITNCGEILFYSRKASTSESNFKKHKKTLKAINEGYIQKG